MRRIASPYVPRVSALLILLATFSVQGKAQGRVVAIGDVHGAYPEFVAILQRVGLIDEQRHWSGGSTVLVQTGDVVDRGGGSRQALDLLMQLQTEAEKQNGKVIPILGNHEIMNMTADLRYTTAEDYGAFATDQSSEVREKAYHQYGEFLAAHGTNLPSSGPEAEAARAKWMAEHPLGFFERRDAFGPQGVYGRWLRKQVAVVQVGDGLFLHGGLNPALHFRNIQQLNDQVHSELSNFDSLWESLVRKNLVWRYMTQEEAIRQVQEEWRAIQARGQLEDPQGAQDMQGLLGINTWLIFSPNGPPWYRGLALEPEATLESNLTAMLARLNAKYIVAAHTVRPKFEIMQRFNNRVFLIDTGMLKEFFGGRASALEIQDGRFTAYYSDRERQPLPPPGAPALPASPDDKGKGEGRP